MPHLIFKDIDRSQADLIERLRPGTGVLAIGAPTAFGPIFNVDGGIRPLRDDMKVFGPAFTVLLSEPDILLPAYATTLAQPGDVLVIDAGGRTDITVWGSSMSLSAMNRKLGGVVIDGVVNDTALLRGQTEYTAAEEARRGGILPVFARGSSPSFGNWRAPGSINVPVTLGGRVVEPGDLIVGDIDGLVVVPKRFIGEIEARTSVLAGMAKELTWHPRIKAGEMWFDILSMGKVIDSLGIKEVDGPPSGAPAAKG
jgi:4-hydroxy-4-methyl-2-oxoglutarate aldolase